MSTSRQLAAIMFADIVGYTAMMQEDEAIALQYRQKLKQHLEEAVEKNRGRILEFRGDGALCSFTSTTEAVKAAIAIQLNMQTNPVVPLRIGLHTGDVIVEGNNIYGDGVNIASRMESFAVPGSIFISGKAYDDIKNQKEIQAVSLGMYALKNVKEIVEIFAISNPGIIVPGSKEIEGKGEKANVKKNIGKSIAVLPFVNMSNDPEQEYFSDGMAEEILNSLAHIKELKVAGRSSSFQFKGKNIDLREVGDKLGVSTVLEGSVRKQGNRIRITAQLINVNDGFHLWGERYDRDMDDIFAIQDEISLAISEKLKLTLLKNDREQLTKSATQNTEAYELYLKGRYNIARRGKYLMSALENFHQAIEIDPGFALAHAGYADATFLSAFYSILPGNIVMERGKQAAETALKLDPTLCEPFSSLGFYHTALMWEWEEGRKNFAKAIEINPGYAFGHYLFALYYYGWVMRDFEKAKLHGQIAIQLEPLSPITYATRSLVLIAEGKNEEAVAIAKKGLDLDPAAFLCYRCLTLASLAMENYKEAEESARQLVSISNRHPHAIFDLMKCYGDTARIPECEKLLNELELRSKNEFIDAAHLGIAYAFAGNLDKAFHFLNAALIEKDPLLITLKTMKWSPALSDDPRFQVLMDRIGFPSKS